MSFFSEKVLLLSNKEAVLCKIDFHLILYLKGTLFIKRLTHDQGMAL